MSEEKEIFLKQCNMCKKEWDEVKSIVEDKKLELNGYQVCFKDPGDGYLVLTHHADDCGSTLMLKVKLLEGLYDGPRYNVRKTGEPECSGKCLNDQNLDLCPAECSLAWIRIVMQYFRQHKLPVT